MIINFTQAFEFSGIYKLQECYDVDCSWKVNC